MLENNINYPNFLNTIKNKTSKFSLEIISFIYETKINRFEFKKLRKLDFFCYLEDYLIVNIKESSLLVDKIPYFLSIIALINHKLNQNINYFNYVQNFNDLFNQIFDFLIQTDFLLFNILEKTQITIFLNSHFKILENETISSHLLKLTTPFLLYYTEKLYLKNLFLCYPRLISIYQSISKQINDKTRKENGFLITIIDDFYEILSQKNISNENINDLKIYAFKIIEFLIDLLSQVSTRRFLKYYLEGKNIIPFLLTNFSKTKIFLENFKDQIKELEHFLKYPLNEETGENLPEKTQILLRTDYFNKMHIILFKYFNLTPTMEELENFEYLKMLELPLDLKIIFAHLNLPFDSNSSLEYMINQLKYSIPQKVDRSFQELALIPNEKLIWDFSKIPNEQTPYINIPKLNLQFLSYNDYLMRNYQLFRYESAFEIRESLEDSIKKINPSFDENNKFSGFENWARMAAKLDNFTIHEVANPLLGKKEPSKVLAELKYSIIEMPPYIKKEWDSLRENEVLFLVSFGKVEDCNGFRKDFGVKFVRGCEIIAQFDEKHNKISMEFSEKKKNPEGNIRTIHVKMDPFQYREDLEKHENSEADIYGNFKLIIRRKPKENIFKPILANISDLFNEKHELPHFMEELILGYCDEDFYSSKYFVSQNQTIKEIDYFDTFLDENHLKNCFLSNTEIPESLKKSYLQSEPRTNKKNQIRFTNKQIEAISFSLNNGLTIIKGPPGTGKTDVVVQIVNLLYHNFNNEKILIITHSNTALNDIFEKIAKLNIDERHLLRLGMGEKDLELSQNFGKYGRVNYLLERRIILLEKVKKIAFSIKKEDLEFTCETAEIFFRTEIEKIWRLFVKNFTNNKEFPFFEYLMLDKSSEENNDLKFYELQYQKIKEIFDELKEIRPLELLRSNKERANYFLSYQAKIIAMTSTHAAMQRVSLTSADFHYDTIIFEESAQIMEIESFICLLLQKSKFKTDSRRCKRIIMLGDPNQLPPIIKNSVIQNTANMQQSLFTRLIRLGAPIIEFDHQGRCRESILELFQQNYKNLNSLPNVKEGNYLLANCGFVNEYQFIDNTLSEEVCPMPHFYQNLEEAEFIVATYMYMVIKGIDPNRITILTVYNGQKFLIRDIIHRKCSWSSFFKKPKKITTVDKFQGQQNDFILLSLVRTKQLGHIRDPRRIVVALSRARLGLYVFGRFELFKGFNELKNIFDIFEKKNKKLEVIPNEKKDSNRYLTDKVERKVVREITNSKDMYKIIEELLKNS